MQKYYVNANILLRIFSYCSPDVKCCMFKSYCATMYCPSMWLDGTVTVFVDHFTVVTCGVWTHYKKITVFENSYRI